MKKYIGSKAADGDYRKVHDFLVKVAREDYTYARFDWMMTNWEYLEDQYLDRIGIWEEDGQIVGVTLYDHSLDVIFPIVQKGYESLYAEMIGYSAKHMSKDEGEYLIFANDNDFQLKEQLQKRDFIATEEKEMVAELDFSKDIPKLNISDGYSIVSLNDEEDYENYLLCLFKGFDHEEQGEVFQYNKKVEEEMKAAYGKDSVNLALKVSIKDAMGYYVAHCGMWYDTNSELAIIEPVCVIPECRKLGLGREVVREGLRRVKALGAKKAVVGSNQQFYYSLGMIPTLTGTVWKFVTSSDNR